MDFYPYTHKALLLRDADLAVLGDGKLCGYCAFTPDEIPQAWHGEYNEDALQYLAIHGGITYCEVKGGDEDARGIAEKAAYDAVVIPKEEDGASLDARMEAYGARRKAARDARLTVPYTHIVFGFDCAHYGDDNNPDLRDPEHVLGLARQMRQQIAAYASIYPAWQAASREERINMIDGIVKSASTRTEYGFGAMVGMLAGAREFGEAS